MKCQLKSCVIIFILPFLFHSCSNKSAADGGTYMMAEPQMSRTASFNEAGFNDDFNEDFNAQDQELQDRKLVKRAELRIRVEDFESIDKPLSDLMNKYKAWPASAGVYDNFRNYEIRVPSGFYDSMLAELSSLGRLLRLTENTEDVTLRYYDLESRLATKRELLKTYQGYLGKANDIDEIMTVESRIADLQREIDQTGTQFRNLASLVDYSTITLEINGPVSSSSLNPTISERLRELFSSFGDVASSAFVVLVGLVIYGVPAVLVFILLFALLFGRVGILKKIFRFAAGKRKIKEHEDR